MMMTTRVIELRVRDTVSDATEWMRCYRQMPYWQAAKCKQNDRHRVLLHVRQCQSIVGRDD